jgi:hypothetical protein
MPIRKLQKSMESSRLRRVLEHWNEVRGDRLMPAWQDIRPGMIKAELPILWSYRYDPARNDFIGGLAGDAIQRLLGGPIKNASFERVLGADDRHLSTRAFRVLFEPAIFFGQGLLFREQARRCHGQRIMLPFSSEDGQMKGILGATDYKFSFLYDVRDEVEHWVGLPVSPGPASGLLKQGCGAETLVSGH